MMKKIELRIKGFLKPHGKHEYMRTWIPQNGRVLDVGCGNNAPYRTKTIRPDVYYVGLDIGIYNQDFAPTDYADEFVLTKPEDFHVEIEKYSGYFDSIISAHNLEHCNDYIRVLKGMCKALKENGTLYLAFPCENSVNFPHRRGTLNFFDDKTHNKIIPYQFTIDTLKQEGLEIVFTRKRYRPLLLSFLGLLFEPLSFLLKKTINGGTWALYGFETVIIGRKCVK